MILNVTWLSRRQRGGTTDVTAIASGSPKTGAGDTQLSLYIYISHTYTLTDFIYILFLISACWFLLSRFIAHHVMFLFDSGSTVHYPYSSLLVDFLAWVLLVSKNLELFAIYMQKAKTRKDSLFLCMYIQKLCTKTIHTTKIALFSVQVVENGPN